MTIKHFLIFVLAFVVGGLFGSIARAEIVPLGKVGGDVFVYDSDTITNNDNITQVRILTASQKYNFSHTKKYGLFGIHIQLDCVAHTYAIDELVVLDRNGVALATNHIKDVHFSAPVANTIPKTLLRRVCGVTG